MRPINVSLDAYTWELAKRKSNFSSWVRNQLRDESTKRDQLEVAVDDASFWEEKFRELKAIYKELKE